MRLKQFKIIALVAALFMVVALLAGCGASMLAKPVRASGVAAITVTGTCTMTIENKKAVVECKTDMMDGTLFKLSVTNLKGELIGNDVAITKNGDNLRAEFDLSQSSETQFCGFAICTPVSYGNQPDSVYEKYGKKFENIESASLMFTQDGNLLVFTSGKIPG